MESTKLEAEKATMFLHGKEREFKFNFSAWKVIEDEINGLDNIDKLEKEIEQKPFKTLSHLMFLALQDKEGITEENIFDEKDISDMNEISSVFSKAFYGSLPEAGGKKAKVEA